ncbi:MAG: hypothetical protein QNJ78_08400 [Gammaproteobacteria bacterium]|nr:hypothetical protein [Gammaproteobacteria bacterium]
MNKLLVSLVIGISVGAGSLQVALAEEVEPVEMNPRKALADCMIEAAASAIATIETTKGSCITGEWSIEVSVPEDVDSGLPIQGSLTVYNEEITDGFTYNGRLTASGTAGELPQDVLCQVQTVDTANTFLGTEFTYASGQGNIFPGAQTDTDSPNLQVTTFESRSTITLADSPRVQLAELDELEFFELDGDIRADGFINVLDRSGNRVDLLTTWVIEPEDDLPLWIQKTAGIEPGYFEEGFKAEYITDQLGVAECEIDIEADITVDDSELTITGELEMEAEDE